jgi:hypothetical protein
MFINPKTKAKQAPLKRNTYRWRLLSINGLFQSLRLHTKHILTDNRNINKCITGLISPYFRSFPTTAQRKKAKFCSLKKYRSNNSFLIRFVLVLTKNKFKMKYSLILVLFLLTFFASPCFSQSFSCYAPTDDLYWKIGSQFNAKRHIQTHQATKFLLIRQRNWNLKFT